MSITLTYLGNTSIPVEVEGLTPDWAVGKSVAEIERFEIFHGNEKMPLAEMFAISGDPSDQRFDFDGNVSGVHWIGAGMRQGTIYIHGPAGRHLGSELRGGEIHVEGNAGGWAGCEMRGGFIHVRGDAGHLVGAAYRGSAQGMRGGLIVVDGNTGDEVGLLMQQGTIIVGGTAGDMIGFGMVDGTIVVSGNAGIRPGAGMRGGSIALMGGALPAILSSFRFSRTAKPKNLLGALKDLDCEGRIAGGMRVPDEVDIYLGDLVTDGTGELYVPHVKDG
ncbi:MAG TPA: formylmethanofuran dehydrogenase subunit C [Lacipirellulaceae bacterium]|nr:formylmethanofuran dehydrogenase subunit C [Lacipirellulaceae bacterium]